MRSSARCARSSCRRRRTPATVEDVWATTDYAGHLAFTLEHADELLAMPVAATAPATDVNITIKDNMSMAA